MSFHFVKHFPHGLHMNTHIPRTLNRAIALFVGITFCNAQEPKDAHRLIERRFRAPTEAEVERYREFFNTRDLEQSILDRYAFRCEAQIFDHRRPEDFVSIHAVDREFRMERHIVRRTFTYPDDPALLFSVENSHGIGSGTSRLLPARYDRLQIDNRIYFTNVETEFIPRDEVAFSNSDRNFDPVTCSMLPLSNFFHGAVSKRRVSGVFGIEKLKPAHVSIIGSSFVAKHLLPSKHGLTSNSFMFLEFVDELPVAMEWWRILGDHKRISYRTETEWTQIEEMSFPVHIRAVQLVEKETVAVDMKFQWKFNDELPQRLFEVSDVTSRDALEW